MKAMPATLRMRFLLVSVLLRAAQAWAGLFRSSLYGRAFGGKSYRVWMASEEFGFDGPFDFETVAEQPPEEAYPWQLAVSKGLVVMALRIPLDRDERWTSIAALDEVYTVLGQPETRRRTGDDWTDAAFLRLRRDGPHAHWVRRAEDGRYIVDYRELLTDLPVYPGRRLEPCALRWTGQDERPEIAIAGRWRTPADADWPEARRLFHLAEVHVHEAVSHLLWTHLFSEGVIIAVVQHLSPGHPIREVLAPHFAFTLQANQNSGKVLLGKGGVFDRLFSCGWAGAAELFVRGDRAWRYSRMVPRLDIAERDVADLPDYPWREDALLVWDVVEAHARRALAPLAGLDASKSAVDEAKAWATAMHAARGDRGWPACEDQDTLVEIVAACVFLTVRHTLVNAQQYPMYGYPPLWQASMPAPAASSAPATTSSTASSPDHLRLAQLPTIGQTLDTMRATFAFSIQYNTLLSTQDAQFRTDLEVAGRAIAARDAARPHPYRVAHPAVLSASLNA